MTRQPEFDNPYAAPAFDRASIEVATSDSLWRDGNALLMLKDAVLPPRCVKCNEPTDYKLRRTLYWHPWWIYVLVPLAVLVYMIVALLVRHTAKVKVGLCGRHRSRRRWTIFASWMGALAGIGLMTAPGWASNQVASWLAIAGIVLLVAAAIVGTEGTRFISARRIDSRYVWLGGVCPEYLRDLPPAPESVARFDYE